LGKGPVDLRLFLTDCINVEPKTQYNICGGRYN